MVAAAIIGSAVVGGVVSSNAAGKAADAQRDASKTASDTELKMFEQNRADMQPWREAGVGALDQLKAGTGTGGDFMRDFTLSDFTRDPGYRFRIDEGLRGIESGAAARGGLLNGGTLKALTQYGQGFASNEFGNAYNRFNADRDRRFNRLSSLAGTGQTATRDVAQMGTQVAGNVAGNQIGAGNARASSYVAQGNAINGGINTLGWLYGTGKVKNPFAGGMPWNTDPSSYYAQNGSDVGWYPG